ncbi:Cytochrome c-type protein TorY [Bibersteinia trehalosi USDA-ARS-USMARC-188]|uniref:Cytochrome c-type protein n=3 Tax=Bibersteinia trehalosi TaxID=47735 RepID=W0R7K0_BIBTR|nr:NapC/NirT family cytochrome c [Bibersteinia trehalosi]AHG81757.1 Cytochrome c-type protein TorY [Bibersteinia trehalosi USDA-ARS-USMARC-188]AHG86432.1 Cytochrome c-type protein TorY [Bibersteinia trehalosi USDA-ARS-USMARC-190]OAQ15059.1 cytochrome C nitrate reductase [Bibersteinia trehalosi Y31]TCT18641.1 trimethylamine-N-oxide reductase (cytochrome c) cytochrome c-type subunit TorY [Bibersteinia trehalosi]
MSKLKKSLAILGLVGLGAALFGGTQYAMHKTSTTEFCVSCHSMSHPKEEWEGSVHFANRKGIRAECQDCHIPHEGIDYLKTKVFAVKDLWHTYVTNKLPDQEAFEAHRLEMAQKVWDDMKANDSATCRSCHSFDAMVLSEQKEAAQKMHKLAMETNQTCIDCHKGIAHFMPEVEVDSAAALGELAKHGAEFGTNDKTLFSLAMNSVQLQQGGEVRLLPFAEMSNWKEENGKVTATVKGWQQAGAESVVYAGLGQRIMVALLGAEEQAKVTVLNTVHDSVTDSDWKEISFEIIADKNSVTANINALNAFGNNLNETHCSGCHAAISADHYTANQWIGVVNSMKDRTSMSADDVRAVTIYLQRNAKDIKGSSH